MKLQISDLTTERQWRAAIGTDQARFVKLLALFTASYGDLFGHSVAQRQADLEVTPSLQSEQELLFFPLFSFKAGLTYDVLGFVSGRAAANASVIRRWDCKCWKHAYARLTACPSGGLRMRQNSRSTCSTKRR
jgi:hypothetical protein